MIGIAALVLIAAAGAIAYKFLGAKPAFNFQGMEISKLTQTGKASGVAVSPDGQYVVYVLRDGEKQSLMVRQVATGSDVPVVPPEIVMYYGLAFSPDGQYIYFVASSRENNFFSSLYKMPVLGGTPVKIVTDIDTSPSFSPDGKQFAFVRGVPEHGRVNLMVAKSDGSDVHVLLEKSAGVTPDNLVRAAWSPDGKTIVATFYEANYRVTLTAVPVADPSKARVSVLHARRCRRTCLASRRQRAPRRHSRARRFQSRSNLDRLLSRRPGASPFQRPHQLQPRLARSFSRRFISRRNRKQSHR